jgi:hypothetical protein
MKPADSRDQPGAASPSLRVSTQAFHALRPVGHEFLVINRLCAVEIKDHVELR